MKAVGIKTLKAKLGEYVRLAKAGETILVTEREEVVAELRPARRQLVEGNELEAWLDELAEQGELTRRSADGPFEGLQRRGRLRGRSSQQILDELREDSR
jgi:antitoxin (DNA-binding transcriptional repressor) of toxin-antitoxin stability system